VGRFWLPLPSAEVVAEAEVEVAAAAAAAMPPSCCIDLANMHFYSLTTRPGNNKFLY